MTYLINTLGWTASICFALCGLPQAIKSLKEGHSHGLSWGFLGLWAMGEVLMMIYVVVKLDADFPLMFNLGMNTLTVTIMIWYKVFPRSS